MAAMDLEVIVTVTGAPALLVLRNAIRFRLDPDNPERRDQLFAAIDAMENIGLPEAVKLAVRTPP
jgi:hypothetical protein